MVPNPDYESIIGRIAEAAKRLREGGVSGDKALDAATELWVSTHPPIVAEVDDDGEEWKNN